MISSILSILLPLFLIFTLPSTRADEVTFNGKFKCNISSRSDDYCILLRYMEDDLFKDDIVWIGGVQCRGPKASHVETYFEDGDGLLDHHYEFFVVISHNCTEDGRIRFYRYNFPDTHINSSYKKFNYEVDLSNKGLIIHSWFDWPDMGPIPIRERRKIA